VLVSAGVLASEGAPASNGVVDPSKVPVPPEVELSSQAASAARRVTERGSAEATSERIP
jgi:hypothetical protein